MSAARPSYRGLAAAATAFTLWGLFPVYLHPLRDVPALQVIANRVTWSALFLLAWMLARGQLWRLAATLTRPRLLAGLGASAALISGNWLVYVWSVTHNHIVDSSLGYYINPLINVVLGVIVLRERLNRAQWSAVALAVVGVAYLTVLAGHPPWIALSLGISFSLYGLVRKVISVDALPGLATETLLLMPLAVAYLLWCAVTGSGALTRDGAAIAALLIGSGLVTAVPLFLFAYGARLLPYSTVGILQYIAPSLQLLCGVLFYHESFGPALAAGFGLIWGALLLYAADGMWRTRAGAKGAPAPARPRRQPGSPARTVRRN